MKLTGSAWESYGDKLALASVSAERRRSEIDAKVKKAKPHGRGFGKPRVWLQTLLANDSVTGYDEHYQGFNGTDAAVKTLAEALVQLEFVSQVLVIDGSVDLSNVNYYEITAYTLDGVGKDSRIRIEPYELSRHGCK